MRFICGGYNMKLFKHYIIIITTSFVWFSFVGDDKPKNDLAAMGLKENIKTVTTFTSRFEINTEPDDTQTVFHENKEVQRFDNNGNLIDKKEYDIENRLIKKWIYDYDSIGKLTKIDIYLGDTILVYTSLNKYNNKGNIIEKEDILMKGYFSLENKSVRHEFYMYDDNGNKYQDSIISSEGNYTKIITKYNPIGNPVEYLVYNTDKGIPQRAIIKYSGSGDVGEVNSYNLDSLEAQIIYKYNDNKSIIQEGRYLSNGIIDYEFTYKYTYDDKKNWINKTELKNNVVKKFTEREIKYY